MRAMKKYREYKPVIARQGAITSWDGVERRQGNRRASRHPLVSLRAWYGGRRQAGRRDEDEAVYVDRYERRLALLAVTIVVMSLFDAGLTLLLMEQGARETNIFMALPMMVGTGWFLAIKLTATTAGVIVLIVHQNFSFLRRVAVRDILLLLALAYVLLIAYEGFLLLYSL